MRGEGKKEDILDPILPILKGHFFCNTFVCVYLSDRSNKAFRHVETSFVHGRNLYLAGLLLVIQGLFTFRQIGMDGNNVIKNDENGQLSCGIYSSALSARLF